MGASLQVASDSRLLWCSAPGLATQAFLANSMRANQEDLGHASEDQCRLTEQVRLATMRATAASESARAMEEALAGARREADTTREQLAALRQREADASAAQTRLQLAVDQAKSHITRCGCGRAVAAPGPLHEAAKYLPAAFQKSAPATQLTPAAASALSPPPSHPPSLKQQLADADAAREQAEAALEEANTGAATAAERLALKERELADWKALDEERKERLRLKEAHLETLLKVGWVKERGVGGGGSRQQGTGGQKGACGACQGSGACEACHQQLVASLLTLPPHHQCMHHHQCMPLLQERIEGLKDQASISESRLLDQVAALRRQLQAESDKR